MVHGRKSEDDEEAGGQLGVENVRRVHVDHLEEKWDGTRTGMETDDEERWVYTQERNDRKETTGKKPKGKRSLKESGA